MNRPESSRRPPKRLNEMTEPELRGLSNAVARNVKHCLPEGTLFAILFFDDPGMAQYVANADRADMIAALRECADRIERNQTIPR